MSEDIPKDIDSEYFRYNSPLDAGRGEFFDKDGIPWNKICLRGTLIFMTKKQTFKTARELAPIVNCISCLMQSRAILCHVFFTLLLSIK